MGRTCETVKGKREEGEGPHISEADLAARRGLKRVGGRKMGRGDEERVMKRGRASVQGRAGFTTRKIQESRRERGGN